jgi:hypothetical protein
MKKLTIALAMTAMVVVVVAAGTTWTNSSVAAAPQGQLYTMPDAGIQF